MRRLAVQALVCFSLLVGPRLARSDERADAIDRILPGQGIRVETSGGTIQGHFVTNRADSLMLRRASEQVAFSYDDLHRIEVRSPSISAGLGFGMTIGGITGAVIASQTGEDIVPLVGGIFLGGVLGGLIGKGIDHWVRVYPAEHRASADTRAKRD